MQDILAVINGGDEDYDSEKMFKLPMVKILVLI